jgi:hypothetical protein
VDGGCLALQHLANPGGDAVLITTWRRIGPDVRMSQPIRTGSSYGANIADVIAQRFSITTGNILLCWIFRLIYNAA